MASRKSYRKNKTQKRKHAKKNLKKHAKKHNRKTGKKTRRNTRRHRRQKQHVRHFHRGGSAEPFPGAKPWNAVDGGNYYSYNQEIVANPENTRFRMGVNDVGGDVAPVAPAGQMGGRRSRRVRKGRKQRKTHGRKHGRKHGGKHGGKHGQKLHHMRGGEACPTCPNTSGVGPAKPSMSDLIPPPMLKAWRTGVNSLNNIRHGFNGEHFARDGPDITNQPIGKSIGNTQHSQPTKLPLDVSGIYTDAQRTAGTI